jgi:hypothetical protein
MKLVRELLFPLIAVLALRRRRHHGAAPPTRSREEKYDERRNQLAESALATLGELGYARTSLREIAQNAEFSHGVVHYYFANKKQLYIAAFATAWVGITLASRPAWVLLPLCFLAAVLAGAVWGAIPGVLKARFGSHEVINTIMLNFVAVALVSYFTQYHYKMPGDPIMQTTMIGGSARIPRISG